LGDSSENPPALKDVASVELPSAAKKTIDFEGRVVKEGVRKSLEAREITEEDHTKWLGEVEDGDLKALLQPFPADRMRIWAISPRVNSPENNDPGIIVPIPGDMSDWKLAG